MDAARFFSITHREHVICNPLNREKLEDLISLLRLEPGARVLDIATGKAEFLIRLAERYGVSGVGIDISPYFLAEARKKAERRVPDASLRFLEMDGAQYRPEEGERFDLAACIGASWIFGGHRKTLEALERMAAGKSWIVVGEPFWKAQPTQEYLDYLTLIQEDWSSIGTHLSNAAAGEELGLELVYTLVSSQDDWDRYEGLQWYAAERWASEHPDEPDADEVLRRVRNDRAAYLRWGRETLGWAVYLFRKGGRGALKGERG